VPGVAITARTQVRPVRETLHRVRGQTGAVQDDRHRVAGVGLGRKDVDLGKWAGHEAECRRTVLALDKRWAPLAKFEMVLLTASGAF
jgi:hypothetical protein